MPLAIKLEEIVLDRMNELVAGLIIKPVAHDKILSLFLLNAQGTDNTAAVYVAQMICAVVDQKITANQAAREIASLIADDFIIPFDDGFPCWIGEICASEEPRAAGVKVLDRQRVA